MLHVLHQYTLHTVTDIIRIGLQTSLKYNFAVELYLNLQNSNYKILEFVLFYYTNL